jgi:CRISPR-associated endonuclease Cas1
MQQQLTETYTDTPPRNGVCVADGYGIHIGVERRRLVVSDGIGRHRRLRRFTRVGHGVNRLVVLGHHGQITLDAVRWLDDVGIQLLHIDTDGAVLLSSARPGLDDARLRRSQALATSTDVGLSISTELLDAKLAGQADVARRLLNVDAAATHIEGARKDLPTARTLDDAREIESAAAGAYFASWPGRVALTWATKDQSKIPDHWLEFTSRRSPLASGSSIRAADPINALLNYLYAIAEAECRLACLALGLDPGLGFLHADVKSRDSLALDLIEVVRPHVDAWVLELSDGHVFRRADFVELGDGHCRVLAPLTHRLAETAPLWAAVVAPWAEHVAHRLADASPRTIQKSTPLTSATRRRVAVQASSPRRKRPTSRRSSSPLSVSSPLGRACPDCGATVAHAQRRYCPDCWPAHRSAARDLATERARQALTEPAARRRRGQAISTGKSEARASRLAAASLTEDDWHRILDRLQAVAVPVIAARTGLSYSSASAIRRGVRVPDPRHWPILNALGADLPPGASRRGQTTSASVMMETEGRVGWPAPT